MTSGLSGTTYENKLANLENIRKRGDMIQVWRILHGQDHVDNNKWFGSAYLPGENERQTRMSSDTLNLKFPVVHTEIRRNLLVQKSSICGLIFHTKKIAKNLNIFKKSSITGGTTERPMK